MKPFDLEAAKRGEPIVCRDGTPAKFIAYVPEAVCGQRVLVLRKGFVCKHDELGAMSGSLDYREDLFMAPKKRTVWVNFYRSIMHGEVASSAFNTRDEADKENELHNKDRSRIGGRAYPVEIEE